MDLRKPDNGPVKDLNDLLRISTDSYRQSTKAVDTITWVSDDTAFPASAVVTSFRQTRRRPTLSRLADFNYESLN